MPEPLLAGWPSGSRSAGAMVEVNEKWACPSARTRRAPCCGRACSVVAGSDSHHCRDIGVYRSVAADRCRLPRASRTPVDGTGARPRRRRRVDPGRLRPGGRAPAGRRGLAVPARGRATGWRNHYGACAAGLPADRGADPGLERGRGDRRVDRPADGGGVPAGVAARLRRRRREHRRHARGGEGQGGAVPGPRGAPAPGDGRPGQGAHAQPRAWRHPRRRLDAGAADHGRRRHLRARRAAHDDPAPGRPAGRRRHRLHQGGQPPGQLPDPLHRATSTSPRRPPPGAGRTCSARSPAWPAARSCTRGPTWPPSAAGSTPARWPKTRSPPSRPSCAAAGWCSSRTPSCWAEEPDTDRGPVEAAAALGARQRAGHHAVPEALVPAAPRAPPRQPHLRRVLVLPLPAAGLHDHVVGGAAHPVLHRLAARLAGVPPAVDRQRGDLPVHHRLRAAHGPADRAARLAAGRAVPRRWSTWPSSRESCFPRPAPRPPGTRFGVSAPRWPPRSRSSPTPGSPPRSPSATW